MRKEIAMSGFRVKGLLDRPSRESLGMVGLVGERENGQLHTEGLVGSRQTIDRNEFAELLAAGDAQQVDGPEVDDVDRTFAALWVGVDFAEKAERLNIRLPPLPKSSQTSDDNGTYWVATTRHIWRVIDSWLIQAFRRSVAEKDAELAALMAWAMPERVETRAALWYSFTEEQRESNLNWWARLERDHGRRGSTPKKLDHQYSELVSKVRSQQIHKVVGFCARAEGGDSEIADFLSNRLQSTRLSFGRWLKEKVKMEGRAPTRQLLQRVGQDMIDEHGALEFCLEVLDSKLPREISFPDSRFVIDGIRHAAVFEALSRLVGENQFTLVFIDRPLDIRRNLLISKDNVPADEVEAVLNDVTEMEISAVEGRASVRFDRERGIEPICMALLNQVSV
jgi:hypothetical protein